MDGLARALMSRTVLYIIYAISIYTFSAELFRDINGHGLDIKCWNLPHQSIILALILALSLAHQLDRRMRDTVEELWEHQSLPGSRQEVDELLREILSKSRRWESGTALFIMCVMIVAYAWSMGGVMDQVITYAFTTQASLETKLALLREAFELPLTGVVSGLVAGAYFGRLATYGSLASQIADDRITVRIHPGHFDGANGLRPVGHFYLFQAMLTAIPLLWLAGWAIAFPAYLASPCLAQYVPADYARVVQWQFFAQWLVVAFFTYLGFVRPILQLRRKVSTQHRKLLAHRLPDIAVEVDKLRSIWATCDDSVEKKRVEDELLKLSHERWHIRNMWFWPMDRNTLRKYLSIEFIASVLPLALGPVIAVRDIGGASLDSAGIDSWSGLISLLAKIF